MENTTKTCNIYKNRKLIYDVGFNDSDYVTNPRIDGNKVICPFYMKWTGMLQRVYSIKHHKRYPTYIGTTLYEPWHSFMAFKHWMMTQDWEGKELDKDILFPGNKHYSPDTCVFITKSLNRLLNDNAAQRGKFPKGVCWNKEAQKFQSAIKIYGKNKHIGHYSTPEDAYEAYKIAKIDYIKSFFNEVDDKAKTGLKRHIKILEKEL